jgi:hypothetical protein
VIYRAQSFKSQAFGSGMDVVWSQGGDFALRELN